MSFIVVPEDPARQLADPGPPEACPHCGRCAFWRNGSYERHLLLLGPCRVQRGRCQSCGHTHARPPEGRPRDLRRTGPDFDWTAYFQELEARGVHTLVTDDDPAFRKALQGCGLDRQLCVVHMRRTVRRRLQRMRQGQDRILPTPEDAVVLQGVVRLVRELPLWGGQLLLVCCEWAHQGAVRLSPPVLALVEHVMDRWNDLVRCVRDPSIPSNTNRPGTGLAASSPGRGWPAA